MRASDITQPATIVIERIQEEIVGQGADQQAKLVLYPGGSPRGIVLSKTTLSQLVEILGSDDTDAWIGQSVEVFNDPSVMFGAKRVGGIRFRAATSAASRAAR